MFKTIGESIDELACIVITSSKEGLFSGGLVIPVPAGTLSLDEWESEFLWLYQSHQFCPFDAVASSYVGKMTR